MQRNHFHRTIAFTLAILLLSTSTGFSIDLHYCQGKFKSFSLFGKASSCHELKKTCPMHGEMTMTAQEEKDCCTNQTVEIEELDEEYSLVSEASVSDVQLKFITAFVYSFYIVEHPPTTSSRFINKAVQLVSRDTYALNEAYLI